MAKKKCSQFLAIFSLFVAFNAAVATERPSSPDLVVSDLVTPSWDPTVYVPTSTAGPTGNPPTACGEIRVFLNPPNVSIKADEKRSVRINLYLLSQHRNCVLDDGLTYDVALNGTFVIRNNTIKCTSAAENEFDFPFYLTPEIAKRLSLENATKTMNLTATVHGSFSNGKTVTAFSNDAEGMLRIFQGQRLNEECSEERPCAADRNMTCQRYCACQKDVFGKTYAMAKDDFGELLCAPKRSYTEKCQFDAQCGYGAICLDGKWCGCPRYHYWDGYYCNYAYYQDDLPVYADTHFSLFSALLFFGGLFITMGLVVYFCMLVFKPKKRSMPRSNGVLRLSPQTLPADQSFISATGQRRTAKEAEAEASAVDSVLNTRLQMPHEMEYPGNIFNNKILANLENGKSF